MLPVIPPNSHTATRIFREKVFACHIAHIFLQSELWAVNRPLKIIERGFHRKAITRQSHASSRLQWSASLHMSIGIDEIDPTHG